MKSFLLHNNTPSLRWGMIPPNRFFEGTVPEGYNLAVAPTDNYIVVDVDCKNGKNGFIHILETKGLIDELGLTYHYSTSSGGEHYWLLYTGDKILKNTSTKYGIDLRIGAKDGNCGGYVKFHPASQGDDIRNHIHEIKETSQSLNLWLKSLFS